MNRVVLLHNMVINAFMEEFGIIPQSPGFTLDAPSLKYLVVSVNNKTPIVVKKAEKEIGSLNIRLIRPKMDYLVLKIADGRYLLVRPDESITLSARDNILLETIATNILDNDGVHLEIGGNRIKAGESRIIGELCRSGHNEVNIKKGDIHRAKIFIDLVI